MTHSIETIFTAARELPDAARQEYLSEACADDPGLRSRVQALLAADAEAGSFLISTQDDPEATDSAAGGAGGPGSPSETAGQQLGKYKLLQHIGEGGFGTVWMAEQREPVRRMVALKVIKLGMDTKQIVARFEAERQALALLDHPNIAKVFDGGSTETGRPYFVMELVKGVPILEYCDTKRLDTRSRLDLFKLVCNAIQHAHQKGIIHRDIKPGNILVTLHDGVPVPKVIDFGIAKATDQELTQKTLFTELHQLVGTPAYMSPEQAEMSGLDIDTRSDIYSLGVLLYELLTGTTPFAQKELMERGFGEMMRIIREDTPHKPSTRLSTLGKLGILAAEQRRADVKRLGFILRGDLDWIVMKCLEKDRSRRYDTASGLAEDIARHINDEPVTAGPPSARYKLTKFVKRNRGRVLAASLIAALLVLGGVGTSFGMVWAIRERDNAMAAELETAKRADELKQVADFQAEQLGEIDPQQMGIMLRRALIDGVPVDQRSRVEQGLAQINFTSFALNTLDENIFQRTIDAINTQFNDQPLVQAQMLQSLSNTLHELGLFDSAENPQARALEIRRDVIGDDHPSTLKSINTSGVLLLEQGKLSEAEPYFREAIERSRRVLGDDDPVTLLAINGMGSLLRNQGMHAEAEPYYRESLEGRRRVLGDNHPHTLNSINNMGSLLRLQGRLAEAESYFQESLAGYRRVLGDDHPITLNSINSMGVLLDNMSRFPEAEPYYLEALEGSRRVLGDDHPTTLGAMNNMSSLLRARGRLDESEAFYREVIEGRRRVLGDLHPSTLNSMSSMGTLLRSRGKFTEAENFLSEALEGRRRVLGDDHPSTLMTINNMGSMLQDHGRLTEAEPYYLEALEGRRRQYGDRHFQTVVSINNYGSLLNDLERFDDALEILESGEPAARSEWAGRPGILGGYLAKIGLAQTGLGEYSQAEVTYLEAHRLCVEGAGPESNAAQARITQIVDLYEAWHAAEPEQGHAGKAQTWRELLSEPD